MMWSAIPADAIPNSPVYHYYGVADHLCFLTYVFIGLLSCITVLWMYKILYIDVSHLVSTRVTNSDMFSRDHWWLYSFTCHVVSHSLFVIIHSSSTPFMLQHDGLLDSLRQQQQLSYTYQHHSKWKDGKYTGFLWQCSHPPSICLRLVHTFDNSLAVLVRHSQAKMSPDQFKPTYY